MYYYLVYLNNWYLNSLDRYSILWYPRVLYNCSLIAALFAWMCLFSCCILSPWYWYCVYFYSFFDFPDSYTTRVTYVCNIRLCTATPTLPPLLKLFISTSHHSSRPWSLTERTSVTSLLSSGGGWISRKATKHDDWYLQGCQPTSTRQVTCNWNIGSFNVRFPGQAYLVHMLGILFIHIIVRKYFMSVGALHFHAEMWCGGRIFSLCGM